MDNSVGNAVRGMLSNQGFYDLQSLRFGNVYIFLIVIENKYIKRSGARYGNTNRGFIIHVLGTHWASDPHATWNLEIITIN
jgi:hypothetical protein